MRDVSAFFLNQPMAMLIRKREMRQRLLRSRQCWDWRDELASAERFRAFQRFGRSLVDRTHVKFVNKIKVVCSFLASVLRWRQIMCGAVLIVPRQVSCLVVDTR